MAFFFLYTSHTAVAERAFRRWSFTRSAATAAYFSASINSFCYFFLLVFIYTYVFPALINVCEIAFLDDALIVSASSLTFPAVLLAVQTKLKQRLF